ncbi:multifunctional fatty acid oxidation complex subunit alpha [Pseudomonas endophytica]|uniref:Multifunctional fatty acid oxidation complex subunit alpha n=1 Tax=Pseudomonas endophytica TaxID=1563157 RepID=A0A0Q0T5G4_9PSED|nr:PA1571 family protein [Pseudomonas endophytica]KQB55074.1 multifunctional fatty acid oxidation complex subunit alpha [Pseudomonas endophytica]
MESINAQAVPVVRTHQQPSLGCAVIDAEGNEVLITEEMIQNACQELEQRLVKPASQD